MTVNPGKWDKTGFQALPEKKKITRQEAFL